MSNRTESPTVIIPKPGPPAKRHQPAVTEPAEILAPAGIWWDHTGLHVDSAAELADRAMSASTISDMSTCPAKWAAKKAGFLPKPGPGEAQSVGRVIHNALERFMDLPAGQRTMLRLKTLLEPDPEAAPPENLDQWRHSVVEAVKGYLDGAVENPSEVVAPFREIRFATLVDGLNFTGAIDRVSMWDGKPRLDDYKTDAKVYPARHVTQMVLYGLAFPTIKEFAGLEPPSEARLLYVRLGESAPIRFTDIENQRALDRLHQGRDTLDMAGETLVFPAKPSNLCGWCPIRESCVKFNEALEAHRVVLKDTAPALTGPRVVIPSEQPGRRTLLGMTQNSSPAKEASLRKPGDVMKAFRALQKTGAPVCPSGQNAWAEYGPVQHDPTTGQPLNHPNPGSYAAAAVCDIASYAAWMIWEAGWKGSTEMRVRFTHMLLSMAYDLQERISGERDAMKGSNYRARDLLKQVLKMEAWKPDFRQSESEWADWSASVVAAAYMLWEMTYTFLIMPEDMPVDIAGLVRSMEQAKPLEPATPVETQAEAVECR